MTIDEFDRLSILEKVYQTFETGEEIHSRQWRSFSIRLFAIEDFFVEIWDVPGHPGSGRVHILDQKEVLDRYSRQIDISDIFTD